LPLFIGQIFGKELAYIVQRSFPGWRAKRVCDSHFRKIARIIIFIFIVVEQTLTETKKGPQWWKLNSCQ